MAYLLPPSASRSPLRSEATHHEVQEHGRSHFLRSVGSLLLGEPPSTVQRRSARESRGSRTAAILHTTPASTRLDNGAAASAGVPSTKTSTETRRSAGGEAAASSPWRASAMREGPCASSAGHTNGERSGRDAATDAVLYQRAVDYSEVEEVLRCPLPDVSGCPTPFAFGGQPSAVTGGKASVIATSTQSSSSLPSSSSPSGGTPSPELPPLTFRCIAADGDTGIAVYSAPVEECPMHLMRAYAILPCSPADVLRYMHHNVRPKWDVHIRRSAMLRELHPPEEAAGAAEANPYRLSRSIGTASAGLEQTSQTSLGAQSRSGLFPPVTSRISSHSVKAAVPATSATTTTTASTNGASRGGTFRYGPGQRRVAIHYLETRTPVPFVQDRDFEILVAEEVRTDGTAFMKAFSTPLGYHMPLDPQQSRYVRAVVLLSGMVARPLDPAAVEAALPPVLQRHRDSLRPCGKGSISSTFPRKLEKKQFSAPARVTDTGDASMPSSEPAATVAACEYCVMEYVGLVHPMGLLPAVLVNMVISAQLHAMRKLQDFVLRHPIATLQGSESTDVASCRLSPSPPRTQPTTKTVVSSGSAFPTTPLSSSDALSVLNSQKTRGRMHDGRLPASSTTSTHDEERGSSALTKTSTLSSVTLSSWWRRQGAMKASPILSTDTVDQARQKLRHQHPDYVEEEEEQQHQPREHGTSRPTDEATESVADREEDNEDMNVNVDDTLRAFAGGGPGALLEEVESDDEEELEDITFKPTDLVFTVATADAQAPRLELYVYDEPEDNMYVHHDMEISAFPLCSSWLTDGTMSMLAVGTMLPFIEVWALDVMDSVEPALVLGGCERHTDNYSKKMLKRNLKPDSHKEAVLSVKWNTTAQNILASGGADRTIKLWDLNQGGVCLGTYGEPEKVQSLDWHATEANLLLSGGFDANVVLRDCRQPDQTAQRFHLPDVIEHVEFVPAANAASAAPVVMVSTSGGHWAAFDTRMPGSSSGDGGHTRQAPALWQLQPHRADTTFSCSRQVPGLFATGGKEGEIALWDGRDSSAPPTMIVSRSYKTGSVLSLSFHPNSPHILGAGGASGAPLVYTITSDIHDVFR